MKWADLPKGLGPLKCVPTKKKKEKSIKPIKMESKPVVIKKRKRKLKQVIVPPSPIYTGQDWTTQAFDPMPDNSLPKHKINPPIHSKLCTNCNTIMQHDYLSSACWYCGSTLNG